MSTNRTHIQRWAPQDWRTSRVRLRSIIRGDLALRVVYFELLNALFENGGSLSAEPAGLEDELGVQASEIERCLPLLVELGKGRRGGIIIEGGRVRNRRVSEDLAAEQAYRADQARFGAEGGKTAGKGRPKGDNDRGTPIDDRGTPNPPTPNPPAPAPVASASARADASASNGTVQERHQRAPARTAADDGRSGPNGYEAEVLRLYTSLPGCRASASRKDRKTAAAWCLQGYPLSVVRAGMFLAIARRVLRTAPVAEPIGSLAYFEPAIAEAQVPPPEAGRDWEAQRDAYTGNLEARIRSWMDGTDFANQAQAQAATADEGKKPP